MNRHQPAHARVLAREDAFRLLNRLTLGAVIGAFAGAGVLGVVSASTIPGTAAPPSQDSTGTSPDGSAGAPDSFYNPAPDAQPPSGISSAPSGGGIVVSGGSHAH